MDWTKEDRDALLSFRDNVDSDDIKNKEIIKKKLLNNRFIIHCLNDIELEKSDAEPDDYFSRCILPYYMVPDTQTDVRNYICYEVQQTEVQRFNNVNKYLEIVFHVLCHKSNIIDKETSIARHDLLGALLVDEFNWSLDFGDRIHLVSNKPSTTDTNYATRTLVFESVTDNNIVKTKNGVPSIINKNIPAVNERMHYS